MPNMEMLLLQHANMPLPESVERDAALNAPDQSTFYTPSAQGYTDFSVLVG